jgi:hypothetical protein
MDMAAVEHGLTLPETKFGRGRVLVKVPGIINPRSVLKKRQTWTLFLI